MRNRNAHVTTMTMAINAAFRPRADHPTATATATAMTTRIARGRHASTSIETFFPPSRISNMLGTITAVAFVDIAGSMGRMERGVRRVEERRCRDGRWWDATEYAGREGGED